MCRLCQSSGNSPKAPCSFRLFRSRSIVATAGCARRIETRLLTKQKGVWAGYSYVWNDAQDDATLAPPEGMELQLSVGIASSRGDEHAPTDVESAQSHGMYVVPQQAGQFRPGIE